ncbi:sigma factor-like helix-turn-helix DNA-binding protein [Arthrobacter sp. Y81]|uniref:sigma factor-like helix-turn-helix DNA-binding protein n=1 Tax=Arthrobacter sp. Y81 TaxID=2058897 RepID=UPI002156F706|nr:sigma factor-like helix-turn-helix DNA-binding protein [Arthrobacter sp. Y81]
MAGVLAKLNDKHREVLMLAYWDGLTTAELAESLGCSISLQASACTEPGKHSPAWSRHT